MDSLVTKFGEFPLLPPNQNAVAVMYQNFKRLTRSNTMVVNSCMGIGVTAIA